MAAPKRVVFLHPDLGIGGAERLVVDAAVSMQQGGHEVRILTSHHDKSHCFTETIDGTLRVNSIGDWLPKDVFGRGRALFAYLRMIYVAVYLSLFSGDRFDLVFIDLVSVAIPVIRLFNPSVKIIFYCHFPDQLLSTGRQSCLKRIYRYPLDWLEEKTTCMADCVLVNSKFTADVFKSTFSSITHVQPKVVYPAQSLKDWDSTDHIEVNGLEVDLDQIDHLYLSINRYERKKNIGLAIEALAQLKSRLTAIQWRRIHLVVAGGYDRELAENCDYHVELRRLATRFDVADNVTFLRSFSDAEKCYLLQRCTCVLYTPDREHFGIVPIEAMNAGKPVVAVDSGGPTETVLTGKTGFLCSPNPVAFANAMERFVRDVSLSDTMGAAGKRRVQEKFSLDTFQRSLNEIVADLLK